MFKINTALVTGGTKGLGHALTLALAKQGAHVFTTGRNADAIESLQTLAREESLSIDVLRSDVSSWEDNQMLAKHIEESERSLDLVIHNASILGPRVTLQEYPVEQFEKVMEINVNGPFMLTKLLLPHITDGGCIQMMSSGVGNQGRAEWGAYCISKFATEGMGQILAAELRERQIRVHIIDPGSMRTEMRAKAYPQEDPNTLITPAENTKVFLWLATQGGLETSGQRYKAKELREELGD